MIQSAIVMITEEYVRRSLTEFTVEFGTKTAVYGQTRHENGRLS